MILFNKQLCHLRVGDRTVVNPDVVDFFFEQQDGSNSQSLPIKVTIWRNYIDTLQSLGEQVYSNDDYKNDWDGGSLPTGVYFYQAAGSCIGEKRGALTISR